MTPPPWPLSLVPRTFRGPRSRRFARVSLVGQGPAMGTARAVIAVARLRRFRVFRNFDDLAAAVSQEGWPG